MDEFDAVEVHSDISLTERDIMEIEGVLIRPIFGGTVKVETLEGIRIVKSGDEVLVSKEVAAKLLKPRRGCCGTSSKAIFEEVQAWH